MAMIGIGRIIECIDRQARARIAAVAEFVPRLDQPVDAMFRAEELERPRESAPEGFVTSPTRLP